MTELKEKIIEAKSIVGDSAMEIIVNDLDLEGWDDNRKRANCPFHTKDGHVEDTPSFIWNPKDHAFKCFGCGKRYGLLDHYQHKGYTFRESVDKLFSDANVHHNFTETNLGSYNYPSEESNVDLSKVYDYLSKRLISKGTVDRANLKQDQRGNIAFEYRDENDKLLMVKYRPSKKVKKGENKNWTQKDADTSHILWGMNQVNPEQSLFITEGEIDRLAMMEVGFLNTVSIPFGANNYHWIERNWDFLDQFEEIVVCADNDEAGTKMIEEVIPRLGEWRCKTLKYPITESGKPTNDLNDVLFRLGRDTLIDTVVNAIDIPIKDVVDLADVEDIDLANAIGVKTGIREWDKRLGKIYLGTVSIWTGINGSGKSTALNQFCIAEPLEQGFKTFVFSGELTKNQFKNWVQYPLAGKDNIKEINVAEDQPTFYRVDNTVKKKIEEWYRGKIYLYDNDLDHSAQAVLSKMKLLARKNGVKNFLIDNLMAIDIDGYKGKDTNIKQKMFVLDLVKFAIQHHVMIHLVAHPRKLDFVKRLTKMDVSGSGDITNLAHYVFAIHRVSPTEKEGVQDKKGDWITEPIEYDALMDVFKNRPIGFQDYTIGMNFDRQSKRFYKENSEYYKKYGWETDSEDKRMNVNGTETNSNDIPW